MNRTDQEDIIRYLRDPPTFGGGADVAVIETHGAYVFLSGNEAIKIKRAVVYDYLDFSTLERREAALRRELALNRPAAPQIYRDVAAITREPLGGLAINGSGTPVEWALRMWRFPAEAELLAVAERGAFTDKLAHDLGRVVADYHRTAERREADGARLIEAIVEELIDAFADMRVELGEERVAAFQRAIGESFEDTAARLVARGSAGHVRRCHGDLHLRNLVLLDGEPVLFDALEFDETLGTCDVLYDLAFLLMDLRHRSLPRAANMVLNAYLFRANGAEDSGLVAMPLFLALRAAILAMVGVQTDRARATPRASRADARQYLDEALAALVPPDPQLIAIGGRSGTGKTTQARQLAPLIGPAPGAVHLRSDLERKAMAGVAPQTPLPATAYTEAASSKVYDRLLARAETLLRAGHGVVLDAVHLSEAERAAPAALAARLGIRFVGLWLEAGEGTLVSRVSARRGDASDADANVVRAQIGREEGRMEWTRVDVSGSPEEAFAKVIEASGTA